MRFRSGDFYDSKDTDKGGAKLESKRADDQPRYKGKSDAEVAADLERRRGPIKFRR